MQDFAVYLPQTEGPNPWQLEILGAGAARIRPGQPYPPSDHPSDHLFDWTRGRTLDEFQAILITQGQGAVETEATGVRAIAAPTVFLVFPGVWHRYRPDPDTGWHERWIAFRGPFADGLLAAGTLTPGRPFFQVGHSETLMAQFQLIQDEVRSEARGFRSISATGLMQILALCSSMPSRSAEENHPMRKVVRQACFIMRERAGEPLRPEELAAELKVGYTYFRRMFRKYTGISPKKYHAQLRLQLVKRMLRDSPLSIGEISDSLGFHSQFHLSNWFKKQTGLAPMPWREEATGRGPQA